ncbi:carbohydrate esterase family 9 protein [Trichoderma atroviride IMI 206040]|uniref:Carbohydrate esterase family 9 protein n=1 Tax=Hypocrea atroviridis (strain ATCC 20476 / IMI 206040) TaxID=452589 RepID=G9NM21_HYPAI|nr:carbohydrate esterase family 9 protein [Trichoderma atroviride IMI 206040]EHK48366.1 carbohydrate esterase family 9 protein [Trichoderma atroviride IMI 206040]
MDEGAEKRLLQSGDSCSLEPPPYQVPAYPRQSRRRRRLFMRSVLSIKTGLSFVVAASVLWLCFAVDRQYRTQSREDGKASPRLLQQFEESLAQCRGLDRVPGRPEPGSRKSNPRWSQTNGQAGVVILKNATLFDGEAFIPYAVDIVFSKGIIEAIHKTADNLKVVSNDDVVEYNVQGRHVTPGLVDMHSHHFLMTWPAAEMTDDTNEVNPDTKAFTPSVRAIDALKAYDEAATLILSGGVTSSLLIPGSANLIAGEGVPVKNSLYSGEHSEPVVEDILLERGIPADERRRYMKFAFGENPKRTYGYTRLGNAWHLREHLQKAKELKEKQDDYCSAVLEAHSWRESRKAGFVHHHGKFPFQLDLESTVAILRGRVIVQNHNYEPEDLETMLRISHEFGYRVSGFHHATEAWKVPNLLKEQGDNVTVAIFAEFSLYKSEAYSPSLYAGHILDKNGIPVAYKSDHAIGLTNAKYLASQAAIGHAFKLPEEKALQSITSVPAKAIDLDFRVGYCRPGFDADIVVWDSHPLSIGATPLQVFIDGRAQLDESQVKESMDTSFTAARAEDSNVSFEPQMRYEVSDAQREQTCSQAYEAGQSFVIDGIQKAFVDNYPELAASAAQADNEPLKLVVEDGEISCFGAAASCTEAENKFKTNGNKVLHLSLQNGHVLPGLTAVTRALGMTEIATDESTGDGQASSQKIGDPESLVYAKYGLWLDGKEFARARLGGVTRAISLPTADASGFVQGVSVEFLTSGKKSLTNGAIVRGDVALHLALGDITKQSEGTVSSGVQHLRKMLEDGKGKHNGTMYGRVAAGELPLVVHCNNKYDMSQLILIKKDFPDTNLVILGGKEAPYVADDLAAANISVILSENRAAPDVFRDSDAVVGPPLTRSVASYLKEAGVTFALAIFETAMPADYRIHDLGPEAGWAAKYAHISQEDSVRLVTSNVESILGLDKSRDLVVFEGNPLSYGASVVLSFHANGETGKLEVATCFPREDEHGSSL